MRYSLCSWCACQWRVDRLSCSVCGNKEPGTLHYFCGEGEDAHRIDLCDACHHYIKTIDCRSLEAPDPCLEDLASLHLDVVAVQKGYERSVPNPWTSYEALWWKILGDSSCYGMITATEEGAQASC